VKKERKTIFSHKTMIFKHFWDGTARRKPSAKALLECDEWASRRQGDEMRSKA
jgi:hypothetical protein